MLSWCPPKQPTALNTCRLARLTLSWQTSPSPPSAPEAVDFADPYMNVALGVVSHKDKVVTDLDQIGDRTVIVISDGKICAPCMIRGARAAKRAPSWQDLRAVYPQTAVCRAFRMHGAHILPKPAHFGCMARESCHELAIFPSEAAFGIHGAQKLPRIAARERTAAESCHGKAQQRSL